MRRRHSSQHDEDDLAPVVEDGMRSGATTSLASPQRRASDSDSGQMGGKMSGNDIASTAVRHSTDHPRVRFSADAGRRPAWQTKRKNSDDILPQRDGVADESRSKTSTLSLDTSSARVGQIMGKESSRSPERTLSPPGQRKPSTSPGPPRGRNRGMSLRSSLFQKNMRERSQDSGSVIEMDDVGSSSNNSLTRQTSRRLFGKKGNETIVEVSSLDTEEHGQGSRSGSSTDMTRKGGSQGVVALPNYQTWIQRRAARNTGWRRIKATYQHARKFVLRINEIPPSKDGRHIDLDSSRKTALIDERTGRAFITNTIRSSRYTAYNFIPRQLFAQFSKIANL